MLYEKLISNNGLEEIQDITILRATIQSISETIRLFWEHSRKVGF